MTLLVEKSRTLDLCDGALSFRADIDKLVREASVRHCFQLRRRDLVYSRRFVRMLDLEPGAVRSTDEVDG